MPSPAECGYCPPEFSLKIPTPDNSGVFLFYSKDNSIKALTEIDDTGKAPRPLTPEETVQAQELVERFSQGEHMVVDFSSTMKPSERQKTLTQIRSILASTAKQQDTGKATVALRPAFT